MRVTDEYVFFWSGIYSNWHPRGFELGGIEYNCAEQYLMAEKARLFGDKTMESRILSAADPADQKRFGRQVAGFKKEDWDYVAEGVMDKAAMAKFTQNFDLRDQLLATGNRTLVEASPEDRIWGIGLHWKDLLCDDPKNWKGTNWLGFSLTRTRDAIRAKGGFER